MWNLMDDEKLDLASVTTELMTTRHEAAALYLK